MTRQLVLLCLAVACPTGCIGTVGGTDEEPTPTRRPTLVNGVVDQGHPSVGKVTTRTPIANHRISVGTCTGTLVGPRSVLTAAHCLASIPAKHATFAIGGRDYRVSSRKIHPDYTGRGVDLAVMTLSRRVAAITPSPIARRSPGLFGRVTLVGFGLTSENGSGLGTKRKGDNRVAWVSPTKLLFVYGTTICGGDSGGPTFVKRGTTEQLAGVHAFTFGACGKNGVDIRSDVFRAWIAQQIKRGASSSP